MSNFMHNDDNNNNNNAKGAAIPQVFSKNSRATQTFNRLLNNTIFLGSWQQNCLKTNWDREHFLEGKVA